jgi:hypothetical protein
MNTQTSYTQPMLFPNMTEQQCRKFQIRNFNEPSFGITIDIAEDADPETTALEHLGYFVVPETPYLS